MAEQIFQPNIAAYQEMYQVPIQQDAILDAAKNLQDFIGTLVEIDRDQKEQNHD